ncbi:hypothetical protein MMC26_003283 [Xylographa opegraphella]|nr:hypothetical protein [Xylographa opegraphella]
MEASTLLEVSLGKLPDCFNSVLIQIGKVFRETSQGDAKLSTYVSKAQSPQIIVRANDQFHEALDDVEIQLLKAKAVLERDLALLRVKRAEREKAAGVSRLRVSSEDRSVAEYSGSKAAETDTPAERSLLDDIRPEVGAGMTMVDTATDEKSEQHPEEAEVSPNCEAAKSGPTEEIKDLSKSSKAFPPAVPTSQAPTPSQGLDADKIDSNITTQISDIDFDSMFADTAPPDNNEPLNYDIDFSTDTGLSQDLLQGNTFRNMTANNDFTGTSNENIDSLMPGIENYVNAHTIGNVSDDFTMLDMSANSAAFDSASSSKPPPIAEIDFASIGASADTGMMEAPPPDSTFDDLFFDDSGDLGMGDGDISGDFGDFDDNWFKSDGQ